MDGLELMGWWAEWPVGGIGEVYIYIYIWGLSGTTLGVGDGAVRLFGYFFCTLHEHSTMAFCASTEAGTNEMLHTRILFFTLFQCFLCA